MIPDAELLRRYATEKSEAAFRELVTRHLPLVYSAALRQLGGDAHLAQDVAQGVFTALARKAASLATHASLAGWLYLGTHHAAAQAVRGNRRRAAREQEAYDMQTRLAPATSAADWERVRPVLDDALRELNEADREAVLLRYFEQRPFAEIGAALHLSEDAARMRVDRALDKLHALLAKRGITSTTAALAVALQANVIAAVPVGLAASITTGAIAAASGGVAAGGFLATLGSNFATSTIATAAAVVAVGAAFFQERDRRAAERTLTEVTQQRAAVSARVHDLRAKLDAATREAVPPPVVNSSPAPRRVLPPSDAGFQAGKEFLAAHPEAQRLIDELMWNFDAANTRGVALRSLGLSAEEMQRAKIELGRMTTANLSVEGMNFSIGPEPGAPRPAGRFIDVLGEARYDQFAQQSAFLQAKKVVGTFAGATYDSDLALNPEQATALTSLVDANRRLKATTDKATIYETDWSAVTSRASDVLSPAQLAVFKSVVAREAVASVSVQKP